MSTRCSAPPTASQTPSRDRCDTLQGPAATRRATLAWTLAAAGSPLLAGCADPSGWRDVRLRAVDHPGYGTDPDLIDPQTPWPLTLTSSERALVRAACDLVIPADDHSPSAGALGVDGFIDEWISAPYERQQNDRALIVSGLAWLDRESDRRFGRRFAEAGADAQRAILDDIAFKDRVKPGYDQPAQFFGRLRGLIMAGFYTLPEGMMDIGYLGNTPISGPYPGPSEAALTHIRGKLAELNLGVPPSFGGQ